MKIYKSFNELNGKTLKEDDIVILDGKQYIVRHRFLSTSSINSSAFASLGYTKNRHKFASKVYGYPAIYGDWPESKEKDYEALTRIALVLLAFFEGETEIDVKIENKWVRIEKNDSDITIVRLNARYIAHVDNKDKTVTVGCQTFTFDSLLALVGKFK